jgi:ketosteroid isomerase-like protein
VAAQNLEIVRRYFDATNRRDFGAARSWHHDDIVLAVSGGVLGIDASTYTGAEAVAEWFGDWFRTFARDYRFELKDIAAHGDRVVVALHHHARGRTSGVDVEADWANGLWLRDGKIARLELHGGFGEALSSAGLAAGSFPGAPGAHLQTVSLAIAALNRRDLDGYADAYSEDSEFRPALQTAVEGRGYKGRDEMRAYLEEMFDTYEVFDITVHRTWAVGELVVTIATLHMRGRGSGIEADSPWGFFFRMEGEKIAFQQNYLDPDDALRAAGLSPAVTTTSARAPG